METPKLFLSDLSPLAETYFIIIFTFTNCTLSHSDDSNHTVGWGAAGHCPFVIPLSVCFPSRPQCVYIPPYIIPIWLSSFFHLTSSG